MLLGYDTGVKDNITKEGREALHSRKTLML